jgi:hypothetical protein
MEPLPRCTVDNAPTLSVSTLVDGMAGKVIDVVPSSASRALYSVREREVVM